jgi:hypothetical protein
MKLDFDEKIIRKARFASGGNPAVGIGYYNILNLYLTNKRLYAEIMLTPICVANIPLNSISSLEAMKSLSSVPCVVYKEGNKEKRFYFCVFMGVGFDCWVRDLSGEIKRFGVPVDISPETVFSPSTMGGIAMIMAIILIAAALIVIMFF